MRVGVQSPPSMEPDDAQPDPAAVAAAAQTEWFRPPTRREHCMAAALFIFFGFFFLLCSYGFFCQFFPALQLFNVPRDTQNNPY